MNFRNLTWGQMGKVQPPKKTFTAIWVYTTLYTSLNTILRKLYAKIEKIPSGSFWENELLNFLKLKFIFFKFKIENFTKIKKRSRDIHPRNIPTNFEKDPKIGCRVTGVDGRTDRPTDRPTTRHGKNLLIVIKQWTYRDDDIPLL